MSRLLNTRHERFALAVAAGMAASRAYQAAGFSARGNAAEVNGSRLLRKAQVHTRIDELLGEVAKDFLLSKAMLSLMLLEDRRIAHERGQASAAGAITERLGKLHGFSFDSMKTDRVSAPAPSRSEPAMIDFAALNKLFGRGSPNETSEIHSEALPQPLPLRSG